MRPNSRLRELLDEADCDYGQLARWVNAVGEERGLHLTYGKSSVSRWLDGAEPHWPSPSLIAEVLGRKVGYDVAVSDLGWKDRAVPAGRPGDGISLETTPRGSLRTLADLAGKDLERRTFLRGAAFAAGAFAGPALLAMTVPASQLLPTRGRRRLTLADAETVRETVSHFRALDQRFGGGGRLRAQVVRFLHGEVSAASDGSFSTAVGQDMFAALAELARLVGYMTFDTGRHALAQRYYIQSLGLAHAADDAVETALTLSCMSFQAVHLGDGREAVALARAALMSERGALTPGVGSMLHAIEGRGLALLGEERACAVALRSAEVDLDRSAADDEPAWLRYFHPAELTHHAAHSMRDLGHPADAHDLAGEALSGYPESSVRSRGFVRTIQATALLQRQEVDAACAAALEALDIAGRVRSARSVDWLRDFQARLRPYAQVVAAREFTERSRPLLTRAG